MGWGGGWGNRVPQTAKDVAAAFYAGRPCKRGNCETDGETYWLFGNAIARRTDVAIHVARLLLNEQVGQKYPLEFSFAGWPTSTTVRHLQALGVDASLRRGQSLIHDRPVALSAWYGEREIAELLQQPVYEEPRPTRSKFVNLTLPLFA